MAFHHQLPRVKQSHNERTVANTQHEGNAVANRVTQAKKIWSRKPNARFLPNTLEERYLQSDGTATFRELFPEVYWHSHPHYTEHAKYASTAYFSAGKKHDRTENRQCHCI